MACFLLLASLASADCSSMNSSERRSSDPAPAGSYWSETRRPWPTLLFVLPLVATYELGVATLDAAPQAVRNGADCWLRSWMLHAGLAYPWALPVALIGTLLAWQVLGRHSWRCSFDTLTGMFGESLLFALLLIVAGQTLNVAFQSCGLETLKVAGGTIVGELGASGGRPLVAARAVSFLGAGIYEELMFRLALIPITFYLLRMLLAPRSVSIVLAVLGSSLVFAAAHYLPPTAPLTPGSLCEALGSIAANSGQWYGFSFRMLAGVLFSLLLLLRGFGVAVGCHALYDLLAGILMQSPEQLS